MTLKLTWLGHSAFYVQVDDHRLLFDPFLTGNPLASTTVDSLQPELILVSHAHGDHVGDTVDIARRTSAQVICNAEMSAWFRRQGLENVHGQNTGGTADYGFVTVKFTIAFHSSTFPDGTPGGNPNGFVITSKDSGHRIYFAGDTALFSDMSLIGDERLDVAILPIGDYFTMGIDDSLRAIKLLQPRFAVPMHYNTFAPIVQNVAEWARRVSNETNTQPIVIDPGGEYTLPG